MTRRILVLIISLIMICTVALAETKPFEVFLHVHHTFDQANITYPITGASAVKKDDGDQYFYLTKTSTTLGVDRKAYFRSMYSYGDSTSDIASGYVTVTRSTSSTQNARYLWGMAVGNHTYFLAGAGQAAPNDPDSSSELYKVSGRWTP